MGPTPERTLTRCTHGAAGCFDPVAHAWVSWRPVRKFIGTTGRGLCLFSSFNEEGDGLSGAQISPKKHKERKLLLLPDVLYRWSLQKNPSERGRERVRERDGFGIQEGKLAVGRRISVFFSVLLSGQMWELASSLWESPEESSRPSTVGKAGGYERELGDMCFFFFIQAWGCGC